MPRMPGDAPAIYADVPSVTILLIRPLLRSADIETAQLAKKWIR